MNEFEQYLMENNIDDTEALNAVIPAQPTGKDVKSAWQIREMMKDHSPAMRDTLPPVRSERPAPKSAPQEFGEGVMNLIQHPVATAASLAAFPMGLLPGMAMEVAGEKADEGWNNTIKLGEQLVRNPGDVGHMAKGLGMSIAELPSIAKEHGKSLWKTMTEAFRNPKPFENMDQNELDNIHKTFEPVRP